MLIVACSHVARTSGNFINSISTFNLHYQNSRPKITTTSKSKLSKTYKHCFLSYLNVIRRRFIAGPFEGVSDVSKNLHWGEKVACIEIASLGEIQEDLCNLGHAVPCQIPLTFSKVSLNLKTDTGKETGFCVSFKDCNTNRVLHKSQTWLKIEFTEL